MKTTIVTSTIVLLVLLSATAAVPSSAQNSPTPQPAQSVLTPVEQAKAQIELDAIHKQCGYTPDETDEKKILKTNECMTRAIRVRQQRIAVEQLAQSTVKADAANSTSVQLPTPQTFKTQIDIPGPMPGPNSTPAVTSKSAENQVEDQPKTDDGSLHSFYGNSLANTPTTCGAGTGGINDSNLVRVHRTILSPKTSSDDFGYRLGHRFVVYQVTIENGSKDFQYMLQDVSIDFSKAVDSNNPAGTYIYNASGQNLSMLRGVPEKGADLDPRNSIYHVLQGIGSVAGAVSGLTSFANVMGPAVAVFNGSFLQGYTTFAPDHTGTQLNRLSDSSFSANTVIDKQRAKTLALFIPMDEVLSHSDQKSFLKDPNAYLGLRADKKLLNSADICVDGTFIQAVPVTAPTLTSVTVAKAPAAAKSTTVTIVGSNLVAGDTTLVLSGATPATAPVSVSSDGKNGSATITLPGDFDINKTTATLQSKSNPNLKSAPLKLQVAQ